MRNRVRRVFIAVLTLAFICLTIVLTRRVFFSSVPDFKGGVGDSVEWKERDRPFFRTPFVNDRKRYSSHYGSWRKKSRYRPPAVRLFEFDPNTLDSASLLKLGLRPGQVRAMMNYRRRGGRWRTAERFLSAPYLSDEQRKQLEGLVKIVQTEEDVAYAQKQRQRDSLRLLRPQKFTAGTIVDLNSADTTELQRIPGIGSGYARAIMRYREKLGGFVSTEQLSEISGLPDGLEKWFRLGDERIVRLKINLLDFKALLRHPYLNYEQVKEIVNYRRQYGELKDWSALALSPHFTEKDFERLGPYSDFGK